MKPQNQMRNITIIATVKTYDYQEYDLISGLSKYISILSTSCVYKFYMFALYAQLVDIEFTKK